MSSIKELEPQRSRLDTKLAAEPIELPRNPFWEIAKTFGRSELIASGINILGTAGLSAVTGDPLILAIGGPLLEKAGFFVESSKEAFDIYKTTPPKNRQPITRYASGAIKKGLPNFSRDLFLHDPIYGASMLWGLHELPQTPAWMLSALAFSGGVIAAAGMEIGYKETAYQRQVHALKKAGFSRQQHLEAKFALNDNDPEKALADLAQTFDLGDIQRNNYHDRYFGTSLKSYNEREPVFRLRHRTSYDGTSISKTAQVVYQRNSEIARKEPSQFRYYPVSKDKFRYSFEGEIPVNATHVEDPGLQEVLSLFTKGVNYQDVFVGRDYAHERGRILISIDRLDPSSADPYTVLEIKAFAKKKDAVREMVRIMRHVMFNYDVRQTTHSKRALTSLTSN